MDCLDSVPDLNNQPDTPPPPLSDEQHNAQFPEVVNEVSVKLKITETLDRLKNDTIQLDAEELHNDFRYLWQMCRHSTNISLRKIVVFTYLNENFLEIFQRLWNLHKTKHGFNFKNIFLWKNLRCAISVLWNSTDISGAMCRQFAQSSLLNEFLSQLKLLNSKDVVNNDKQLYFLKSILGVLHNTASNYDSVKSKIRSENGVDIFVKFLDFDNFMVKSKALITLSYIVDEEENETINAEADTIHFITNVLKDSLEAPDQFSKQYGMSAIEVAEGLNNIAVNDANKVKIVKSKALPLLVKMMKLNRNCQYLGVMVIWTLAFNPVNCKFIAAELGCIEALNDLINTDDATVSHAARGALWEINDVAEGNTLEEADCAHVMISYQWDAQPILLKLKDKLKESGYKVWMDIEHMTGSTLEAMALAVEKAAVVLICMSEKYKTSPSCRTEAEYIYRLRKDIIPIQVEKDYEPDGWLGMMIGTKLYFKFTHDAHFNYEFNKLDKELRPRGHISSPCQQTTSVQLNRENSLQTKANISNWKNQQVVKWLECNGLCPNDMSCFGDIDGVLLLELKNIKEKAPAYFYQSLEQKLALNFVQILRFSKSLDSL